MTDLFREIINVVLTNEGGYVWHPSDPGGETNYGITDRLDGVVDGMADIDGDGTGDVKIKKLTIDQAKEIYYRTFWLRMNLWLIFEREIILQIFDFGINAGMSRAIRTAQKIAGTLEDGLMGHKTAHAINNYDGDFLKDYKHARRVFYEYLADKKPKLKVFLRGWLKRIEHTHL